LEPEKKAEPVSALAMFGIGKAKAAAQPDIPKIKKSTSNFYVHSMLATLRAETIPECKYKFCLDNLILILFRL